jgi:hypothetical protein
VATSKAKPPLRRKASGPTQPEAQRERKQKLLRLTPEEQAQLARLAARWGLSESQTVARAIAEVLASPGYDIGGGPAPGVGGAADEASPG